MKNWKNAEIVEVGIKETASGMLHTGNEKDYKNFLAPGTHDHEHCDHGYPDEGVKGLVAHIADVFLPTCNGTTSNGSTNDPS